MLADPSLDEPTPRASRLTVTLTEPVMTMNIDTTAGDTGAHAAHSASASADALTADPSRRAGSGRATGKVILIGEHSVVYGHPAIALPITSITARAEAALIDGPSRIDSGLYHGRLDRAPERLLPTATAVTAAFDAAEPGAAGVHVRVHSDIPSERGIGSSAAVAAAIVTAVSDAAGRELTTEERFALIQQAERAAHGSPSGLDARAVCADGPIWFHAGAITPIKVRLPLHFVVADSGVRGRTREAVAAVRALRETAASTFDASIAALGALAHTVRESISSGDTAMLGETMNDAHRHLGALDVGDPALDHLAAAARDAGAAGAKLTGGGRGGCVIALADDPDHAHALVDRLRAAGAPAAWTTHMETA